MSDHTVTKLRCEASTKDKRRCRDEARYEMNNGLLFCRLHRHLFERKIKTTAPHRKISKKDVIEFLRTRPSQFPYVPDERPWP